MLLFIKEKKRNIFAFLFIRLSINHTMCVCFFVSGKVEKLYLSAAVALVINSFQSFKTLFPSLSATWPTFRWLVRY